jgi:hypothetical protein
METDHRSTSSGSTYDGGDGMMDDYPTAVVIPEVKKVDPVLAAAAASTPEAAKPAVAMVHRRRNAHVLDILTSLQESKDHVLTMVVGDYSHEDIGEIVEALNQNEYITVIRLVLDIYDYLHTLITPICKMIQNRTILEKVFLYRSPHRLTDLLVRAASFNPKIQSIVFDVYTTVTVRTLVDLLERTTSLASIELQLELIVETHQGFLKDLEGAFRTNTTLEKVALHDLGCDFALALILRGLSDHNKVRELLLSEEQLAWNSWKPLNAIRYFQEKSKTIELIKFF